MFGLWTNSWFLGGVKWCLRLRLEIERAVNSVIAECHVRHRRFFMDTLLSATKSHTQRVNRTNCHCYAQRIHIFVWYCGGRNFPFNQTMYTEELSKLTSLYSLLPITTTTMRVAWNVCVEWHLNASNVNSSKHFIRIKKWTQTNILTWSIGFFAPNFGVHNFSYKKGCRNKSNCQENMQCLTEMYVKDTLLRIITKKRTQKFCRLNDRIEFLLRY